MLSTRSLPDRLARTDNVVLLGDGNLSARPGAVQVLDGDIAAARPWGNRALVQKEGRLVLWDGAVEHDIRQVGRTLDTAEFQALTQNAERESRLYVADGTNPLWYLRRQGGGYERVDVTNTVTGTEGAPYPLPVPSTVCNWQNRLWIGWNSNRVQHCQAKDPDAWDPLWTLEFQGQAESRTYALEPQGDDLLAVGTNNDIRGVTGTSQYNWQRLTLSEKAGVVGPHAMASFGGGFYWVSPQGLHRRGESAPLSEDIRELFAAPLFGAQLAVDKRRRLLLMYLRGRLLVMHLDQPGRFGEIKRAARGVVQLADYVGWYGPEGLWLLGSLDEPDQWLDGTRSNVEASLETWDQMPNTEGDGRAFLARTVLRAKGSTRGPLTYEVSVNGQPRYSNTATLADETATSWGDLSDGDLSSWPTRPVRREFAPQLAGASFRHRISASCHLELLDFSPVYRTGRAQ